MARLGEIPFGLYYCSIDSTPLFVSRFDVMLRRYGHEISVNLLDREGDGRLAITL